jgi:hypothetical protein
MVGWLLKITGFQAVFGGYRPACAAVYVDTVRILARKYPGAEIICLMGSFLCVTCPWHDPQGLSKPAARWV